MTGYCDRCGEQSSVLLYGACGLCIHRLLQADKAKTPPSAHRQAPACPDCAAAPLKLHAPGCAHAERCANCDKVEREAERTRDFYELRMNALQKYQKELPEPHRTIVCNILANGTPKP